MAARSLIQLFRAVNPALLHKKDRVRKTPFTRAVLKMKVFGCRGGRGGGGEKEKLTHPHVPSLVDRLNLLFVVNLLNNNVL